MGRPAHTALFQPTQLEKPVENVNFGSFCGLGWPLPLLVAAITRGLSGSSQFKRGFVPVQ